MGRSGGMGPPMRHLDIRHRLSIHRTFSAASPSIPDACTICVRYQQSHCPVFGVLVKSKGPGCESPGRQRGDNVNGLALPWAPIIS